jgi:seryl-tRNA synthetase
MPDEFETELVQIALTNQEEQLTQERQNEIKSIIINKDVEQRNKSIEILNFSEQKLKNLEDETDYLQSQKKLLDTESETIATNIKNLGELKVKVDANRNDLAFTIKSNLNAIDSLRKDGVVVSK